MKKTMITMLAILICASIQAQDLSAYKAYQIREGVELQILDIKRVEQYGWDNLEIKYRLKNTTDFEIRKLDFNVHLLDKNHDEIGTIEAHVFSVPKRSDEIRNYVDAKTAFGSDTIAKHIGEVVQLDVYVDEDSMRLTSIKNISEIIR